MAKFCTPVQAYAKVRLAAAEITGQGGGVIRIGSIDDMIIRLLQTDAACMQAEAGEKHTDASIVQGESGGIYRAGSLSPVHYRQAGAAHRIGSGVAEESN